MRGAFRIVLPLLLLLLAGACSSLEPRRARAGHGYWPDGRRFRAAARTALHDPATWMPAAGAAAIAAGGWDGSLARWASRETPIFGSRAGARDASDRLRGLTHYAMIAAALAAPDGGGPWQSRLGRLAVDHGAAVAATSVTLGLKRATARERPDRSDRESFPSGHASRAFAYAAAGRANLRGTNLSPRARRALGGGMTALAAGTAWARVEAGVHYPTDVLAGAALGNFLGVFFHEAFAGGSRAAPAVRLELDPGGKRVAVQIGFQFR